MNTKNSLHTISCSAVEGDIALHVDLTAAQKGSEAIFSVDSLNLLATIYLLLP